MKEEVLDRAREAWRIESEAVGELASYMDYEAFGQAVSLLAEAERIAVSGCGHTGIACRHMAHLLCCIERPARFLSPSEGNHGGLGYLKEGDVLILASRGGETKELFPMLEAADRKGVCVITVTENRDSGLAKGARVVLPLRVSRETDPFNSQGTTSFVIMCALFDALQTAVLEETGYSKEQFALIHPGGAVGKRLNRETQPQA